MKPINIAVLYQRDIAAIRVNPELIEHDLGKLRIKVGKFVSVIWSRSINWNYVCGQFNLLQIAPAEIDWLILDGSIADTLKMLDSIGTDFKGNVIVIADDIFDLEHPRIRCIVRRHRFVCCDVASVILMYLNSFVNQN